MAADPADRAQAMVELAERALAGLAPLRFDVARTAEERDAVLRMRFDLVVSEGWIHSDELPGGREGDADDARATFVTCHEDDVLVGSMRLVGPEPAGSLPIEREFGLRARPAGRVVEVGRLVVAPNARPGRSHRIIGGLSARAWGEMVARGCERALSTATPELIELYGALGLRVTVLGPARPFWGALRAPISIEGDEHSFAFLTTTRARAGVMLE